MKTENQKSSRLSLIFAMIIFGTIGLLRKYIDLPSSIIALARAVIGTGFLLALLLIKKQRPDLGAIRKNLPALLLSGAVLGFNWILLFEAYLYTTVAAATLCYYMAPMLVILASAVLFREKLTWKRLLCVLVALAGIVLVSGILDTGFGGTAELKGIALGLGAAALYAAVVLLNKKISGISSLDRTILQLAVAATVLLPYTLLTEDWSQLQPDSTGLLMLLVAGIVHTGLAYALYFGSIRALPTQTVALYSYLDPILAVLLSALFLREPISPAGIVGAVLVLGAAVFSERT